MRRTTFPLLLVLAVAGCNDLRDFAGEWRGARVGDSPEIKVGVADDATATLVIAEVDTHGLRGQLTVGTETGPRLIENAAFASLPGAETDALATMSFAGAPMRVYLAFVPSFDSAGDALAMIGLYDSRRIDLRVLRGGTVPVYAIFALKQPE